MIALRPVGEYIPHRPAPDIGPYPPDWSDGGRYAVRYCDSGTTALTLALRLVANRRPAERRVLLPGYGCPDLVAAVIGAGLRPQLVDLENDRPWLDLAEVERQLSGATAIVAVNFLGMRERIETLSALARPAGVPVIEDSAQMAPFSGDSAPSGDLVIFSFGRGKPLPLLTGGALLLPRDWASEFDRELAPQPVARSAVPYLLKSLAYNVAIQPRIFGWLRRLPMLRLGDVRYHPFVEPKSMHPTALARLATVQARALVPSAAQRTLAAAIQALDERVVDLPTVQGATHRPLLRYPVLLPDGALRQHYLAKLDAAGLGASPMYARALFEIDGVPEVAGQSVPRAAQFAARLLTLPVHSDVSAAHVARMISILGST
jgi:dTDP-4-amino-4,6-dideoxygalactose transaminase